MQVGTVTVFVAPYRIDMSLNLVLIALGAGFLFMYAALRGLLRVMELPEQARRWRAQQRERSAQQALLNAMVMWMAGRFLRSRKAALQALVQVDSLLNSMDVENQASLRLMRSLLHLLAAETAHALRDTSARDQHFQQALDHDEGKRVDQKTELRDAALLNAARWSLHDRDAHHADQFIDGRFITGIALEGRVEVAGVVGHHFRRIAAWVHGDERDDGLRRTGRSCQFAGHMVEGGHGTRTHGRAVREAEEHQPPLALQQRGGGPLAAASGSQFHIRQGARLRVERRRTEFGWRRGCLQPAVGGHHTKAHRYG
jgi:hypothetical protein